MKIAIPVCGDRVSTVFDAADELLMIETRPGGLPEKSRASWRGDTLIARATQIRESGVQVLICGALLRPMERMLETAGIQVIPFIRGTVDEVFEAFCKGDLRSGRFLLPGYEPFEGQGDGRRRRGGCNMGGYNKS